MFLQQAYDGQDFTIFTKDILSWMVIDNVAHITKWAQEANWHELISKELARRRTYCFIREVPAVWGRYPAKDR